jgi:hypothetical protein
VTENQIGLAPRIAHAFRDRDNYRLRMVLIGRGLWSPHLELAEPRFAG